MKLFVIACILPLVFCQDCPEIAPAECDFDNGELSCDMGTDEMNCWIGDYCMPPPPDGCANICPVACGPNEIVCDNGWDENQCWMGDNCADGEGKHLFQTNCMVYELVIVFDTTW